MFVPSQFSAAYFNHFDHQRHARAYARLHTHTRKVALSFLYYRSSNIEVVTKDDSEFWFMGFLRYEKAIKNLNNAISMANKF
jgi:uncharacterized protein YlbG (UPF0298 family)